MCRGTAAWYHAECPGLVLPNALSASSTVHQHDAALKLMSSHRLSENTAMQLPDPRILHLLSAALCLLGILACLEPG